MTVGEKFPPDEIKICFGCYMGCLCAMDEEPDECHLKTMWVTYRRTSE